MRKISEFIDLEIKYDMSTIVEWPYLRIYFGEQFILENNPGEKNSSSAFNKGIKFFFYGIKHILKKYKYLAFISSNQRKSIGDKSIHPFDFLPNDILKETLFIELPIPNHIPIKNLAQDRVISRYFFLFFEFLLVLFYKIFTKNKYNWKNINNIFGTNINGKNLVCRYKANYLVGKIIGKFFNPRLIFCTVPYTMMGYIKAFNEQKITVVELQHGYAGKSHRAYVNSLNTDTSFYPNYFLSWGDFEKAELSSSNCNFLPKEKIFPVGNFYLDYLKNNQDKIKLKYANKFEYKVIISISIQDPLEDILIPYIKNLAELLPNIGLLLLPRAKDHQYYKQFNFQKNVLLAPDLNTYEGILVADIHSTIYSTTAMESIFFNKPTILINENNLAHNIYGETLDSSNNVFYANSIKEFGFIIKSIGKKSILNSTNYFFVPNFKQNLNNSVQTILSNHGKNYLGK